MLLVADINPVVKTLPPVMLLVADINPVVKTLPLPTLPVVDRLFAKIFPTTCNAVVGADVLMPTKLLVTSR